MQNKDRVRGILHFAFSTSYENTWWLAWKCLHAAECASHLYHATENHIRLEIVSLIITDFDQYFFCFRRIYLFTKPAKLD
jgi:hypothetical protein